MIGKRNSLVDITGQKFGRLTVVGFDDERSDKKKYWMCLCNCGKMKSVRSDCLKSGTVTSCGCRKKEQDRENLTKHHSHLQSGTRLYKTWQGMKKRCYCEHDSRYANYGGRGIKVCDEWKNDFAAFYEWALNSGYSEELTIDRIDVDGDYEPSNCRWADIKTQCNSRTSNIRIKIGNATKSLQEWCEIFELNPHTIRARYSRNGFISIDDLFNR